MGTIERLRQILECCTAGNQLDTGDARWFAAGVDRFLSRECASLDDAFMLRRQRGGVPWWMEDAIQNRDNALRRLADTVCPNGSKQDRVRTVRNLAARYAATAWRFDSDQEPMPTAYYNGPKELLWRAFKSGATMPLSERHLRNILV